jgi:hypothetical protein
MVNADPRGYNSQCITQKLKPGGGYVLGHLPRESKCMEHWNSDHPTMGFALKIAIPK